MKRTFLAIALAASLLTAVPGVVLAQSATAAASSKAASPSQLVLANSTRVLGTLEARRPEFSKNPAALEKFVSGEFNQIFDREYAGRLVLGRHGRGASDADVNRFADALSDNLMRRYGASLLDFNTALKVRVKSETPLRGGSIVKVSTEMLRQGGEPIPVDYLMRKVGNHWKVFDVMVEGVSFVQTFRNQFDTPLAQKSIGEVTKELRAGQIQAKAE
ncbi:MAG: ABC transporter substrate-binding protein [Lysobacter sp.]|nr:ABC transporter substrate-binding protein [Lysobacter sp.]MDQ3269205.1 ABC transporter substrate-binding protein [Pseudomonadota bacterium]